MTFEGKVDTKYPTEASTCIIIIHHARIALFLP